MRRLSLAFSILVLMMSTVGIIFSRNLVEFFLCAEIISVTSFFIFSTVIIPAIFPPKVKAESVFIGGAAKPPYIHDFELCRPNLPLLAEREEETA